jgi:hypothetical protein
MRLHLLVAVAAAGAVAPSAGAAIGFPITAVDTTQTGATAPGDPYRYVALPGGRGSTVLVKIRRADGVAERHRRLNGRHIVAPVAQDASTTGLSADGATLVLSSPRRSFPQRSTRLAVIDTRTLRPTRELLMRGDYGLDGVSPDGRLLYLVAYRSGNPNDYAVRIYDLRRDRLLPKPVVDPRNPDEKMAGLPITRATGADGRFAYTLYLGTNEPFVHALDTAGRRAFCVDLPGLLPDELMTMRLVVRSGRIDVVTQSGEAVRHIDARTFRVTKATPAALAASKPAKDPDPPGNGFPWELAAVVAVVAAAALFVLRRRYAAGTDSAASRSASSSSPTVP